MELRKNHTLQGGKYRIIEKIGQGGFAITYKADFATEVTGSMGKIATNVTVAIKEFFFADYCTRDSDTSHITISSPTGNQIFGKFKEKLKKEAAILSRMRHPNIVSVLDIFEENNTVYMVMEYVSGGSLKQVIHNRGGRLDEATALRYASQLCEAVAEIHRNNVLHLDIKPGNILIDPNDNVKLIDFGVSKQYNSDTHAETSTTPVGISKGFAPPEQYTGVSQFSPATDIYAIGATIYNMLSGSIPPESMSLLEEDLPRINGISDQLWIAITRAMSTRRNQRPQSVAQLSALLPSGNSAQAPVSTDEKTQICDPMARQHSYSQPVAPAVAPAPAPMRQPASEKTAIATNSPQNYNQANTPPRVFTYQNTEEDNEDVDDTNLNGRWCVKSTIAKIILIVSNASALFSLIYYPWLIYGDHYNFTGVDYFLFPTLTAMLLTSFYVSFIARKEYRQFSKEWWIRLGIFVSLSVTSFTLWIFTADHLVLQSSQFIIINILSILTSICHTAWLIRKQKALLAGSIAGYIGMILCCISTPLSDRTYLQHNYYDNGSDGALLCYISIDSAVIDTVRIYIDKYEYYYISFKYSEDSADSDGISFGLMRDREINSWGFGHYSCSLEEVAPCIFDSIRYHIDVTDMPRSSKITICGYTNGQKETLASGYLTDHYICNDSIQNYYFWYSSEYCSGITTETTSPKQPQ